MKDNSQPNFFKTDFVANYPNLFYVAYSYTMHESEVKNMNINISIECATIEIIQKVVKEFSKIEEEHPNVSVSVEVKVG